MALSLGEARHFSVSTPLDATRGSLDSLRFVLVLYHPFALSRVASLFCLSRRSASIYEGGARNSRKFRKAPDICLLAVELDNWNLLAVKRGEKAAHTQAD